MAHCLQIGMFILVLLLVILSASHSEALSGDGKGLRTSVFLSPKFVLRPGLVENRIYHNIDFPKGHIAVKSFNAEVVDEAGNPVSLNETYLHHWIVERYYESVDVEASVQHSDLPHKSGTAFGGNAGLCQGNVLRQHFGLGSETRKTATHVPDPFGIEVGNPAEVPAGYEERWLLNVHAIDTRGVVDKLGCTECRCDLYNVTRDEYGRQLRPDYDGGLLCCYDHTQCRLRDGFEGARRAPYLKYTVKWLDWKTYVVPVKIYVLDVTDTSQRLNDSAVISTEHNCHLLKYREAPTFSWVAAFLGVGIAAGFVIRYRSKGEKGDGYQRIST